MYVYVMIYMPYIYVCDTCRMYNTSRMYICIYIYIYIHDLSFNVLLMIYVYVIYTYDIYMTKLATIATTTTPTRDVELFRHPKPS